MGPTIFVRVRCSFLHLLLNGTYDYVRHKILYVFLDHFPEGGRQDGWIADDYLRTFLTRNGMSRVEGGRPDDVFVINDADEIPAREGLLFLKLFDGWTEPFAIHMRKVSASLMLPPLSVAAPLRNQTFLFSLKNPPLTLPLKVA